jgi:hypothetical protein
MIVLELWRLHTNNFDKSDQAQTHKE